jgi:hypothetical protein
MSGDVRDGVDGAVVFPTVTDEDMNKKPGGRAAPRQMDIFSQTPPPLII